MRAVKAKPVRVEPSPSFCQLCSGALGGDTHDLVVKATNAGMGTAYNFTLGMPSIPGMSDGQMIQVLSSYSDHAGEIKAGHPLT